MYTGLRVFHEKKKDKFCGIFRINFAVKLADFVVISRDFLRRFRWIFRVTSNFAVKILVNFVGFCAFLSMSRDFVDLAKFHGPATVRNTRSPTGI